MMEMLALGSTTKEIAAGLGISERTVRNWKAAPSFPEAKKRRKKSSSFDEFAPYVLKRWQEGEHNGTELWREIVSLGYTGSERTVYRHIETQKTGVRSGFSSSRSSPQVYCQGRCLAVCP